MVAVLGLLGLAACSGPPGTHQHVVLPRAIIIDFTSSASDAHAHVAARCHLSFEYQNRSTEVSYRDPGGRAERAAVACAKSQPEVISVGIGV